VVEQDEADRLHEGLRRSFAQLFGRIEDARLEDRAGYRLVVCPRVPFPGLNGIWAEGADEPAVHELERAINEVEGLGVPCWIEVRAGRTPAIEREARRLGFTHEDPIPGMVVQPAELAIAPGPELEVTRVREAAGLAVAETVAAAGFEVPREQMAALFTPRVASTPGLSIYVARAQGRPVSTATAWIGDGGVGIFNVATPPEHRGRGYGRAITAKAVEAGFASGADLAWLQASPLGEPVYGAMGFRQVASYVVLGRPSTS
jgi:ribosomal protein S18 acetylase RimI-like enzyme